MKKLSKIFVGIGALTMLVSGAVAIGLASSSKEAVRASATTPTINEGAQRINVFIPKETWVFNDNVTLFSVGVSDDYRDFDFVPDLDIGTVTINNTARGYIEATIGSSTDEYWVATKELPANFSTTWWDFTVSRNTGSAKYDEKTNHDDGGPVYTWANSFIYTGNELTRFDFWYKVAFHTGINLEDVSCSLERRTFTPDNPDPIEGYTFAGWYLDEEFTKPFIDELSGDTNLYAKYTKNDFVARKYMVVDGSSDAPVLIDQTPIERGSSYYPDPFHVSGYTFDGWYEDSALTEPFGTVFSVESDVDVYGKYTLSSEYDIDFDIDLNNSGWELGSANYAIKFVNDSYSPTAVCWSEYLMNVPAGQRLLHIHCPLDFEYYDLDTIIYRYNVSKTKADWDSNKETDIWNQSETFNWHHVFPMVRIGDLKDENQHNLVYKGPVDVMGGVNEEWDRLDYLGDYQLSGNDAEAYNLEVELEANTEFKIQVAPYADGDYYSDYTCHALLQSNFYIASNGNIHAIKGGTYAFFFNTYTHHLHITKEELIYADEWAASFLGHVVCSGYGSITLDEWSAASSEYGALDADTKGVFESIASLGNEHGCDIEKAIYIYDFILIKYGIGETLPKHTDFIGRFSSGGVNENVPTLNARSTIFSSLEQSTSIAIVVTTTIVSITLIGGVFYIRKRKHI